MERAENQNEITPDRIRHQQIDQYWAGDLSRRVYLLRRQRKAILENCRRIAVIGADPDPNSSSFVAFERLLGLGLEIIPVFADRESFLGLRCYKNLRDIPGKIDIVQVYPNGKIDCVDVARAAVDHGVSTFWIEQTAAASREVEDLLAAGHVQLVEYESLEHEYLKHVPVNVFPVTAGRRDRKAAKVKERMSKNPITVKPEDGLKDAIWKMEHGHFRHLPVIDDKGKLIGMLSDRDVRLIQPSFLFNNKEDAAVQLWSIAVQQAAVFDPVRVKPETTLKEAAETMLRWHVGGLPVVDDHETAVGMITYTDILREFVHREENE
ncbi:MAG TPA: CBS domain-containing protein [Phototrophicaceae bacterium]|jgi:acetoin utilization protein AcuB|nr:CBS domain-containing protein [Phototrophicaceae bacterium]